MKGILYSNLSQWIFPVQCAHIALQRKSQWCIPRKGIARPQSQFPHSCVCGWFIFPGSIHIFSCSRIYKSLIGMWMWKLGLRRAIPFLRIFVSIFRYCVFAVRTGALSIKLTIGHPGLLITYLQESLFTRKDADRWKESGTMSWFHSKCSISHCGRENRMSYFNVYLNSWKEWPTSRQSLPSSCGGELELLLNLYI